MNRGPILVIAVTAILGQSVVFGDDHRTIADPEWRYTVRKPPVAWRKEKFDDSRCKKGHGGFGTLGTAIHPSYVEGQIQGGSVQGIGWALNEEYVFDETGVMKNAGFLDYRMPTTYDVPMIDTILVEVPNPGHPYGVRGVGEVPIVPPPAAIANAIYNAVGIRMRHLPMSPPHLLQAMLLKRDQSNGRK